MSDAISAVQSDAFNSIEAREKSNEMGKNEFLKLLVTQLKYQDPLEPLENEAFVAQLAQFSTLETMQNMSQDFEGVQTYNLIGKRVLKIDPATLEKTEGTVGGVRFESGKYYLILPQAQTNNIDKNEVLQAFSDTTLDYNFYKKNLFTDTSLTQPTLVWQDSIQSLDDLATALGIANKNNVPHAIKNMWEKENTLEIPVDDISYVYGS